MAKNCSGRRGRFSAAAGAGDAFNEVSVLGAILESPFVFDYLGGVGSGGSGNSSTTDGSSRKSSQPNGPAAAAAPSASNLTAASTAKSPSPTNSRIQKSAVHKEVVRRRQSKQLTAGKSQCVSSRRGGRRRPGVR